MKMIGKLPLVKRMRRVEIAGMREGRAGTKRVAGGKVDTIIKRLKKHPLKD